MGMWDPLFDMALHPPYLTRFDDMGLPQLYHGLFIRLCQLGFPTADYGMNRTVVHYRLPGTHIFKSGLLAYGSPVTDRVRT